MNIRNVMEQIEDLIGFYHRDKEADKWLGEINQAMLDEYSALPINAEPGQPSLIRLIAALTLLLSQKVCEIKETNQSWRLKVDGQEIVFHGERAVKYFKKLYDSMGYYVMVNKIQNPFKKGDKVIYVPMHAGGDIEHKDCEYGVVSSVKGQNVFVKYDNKECEMETGDEPYTAQSTHFKDLVKR